jgi:hypothetical protein
MSKSQLRKKAYKYIEQVLSKLHHTSSPADLPSIVPLEELMSLKEGQADPSVELVAALKQLLKGSVAESEIDTHLVTPFQRIVADRGDRVIRSH